MYKIFKELLLTAVILFCAGFIYGRISAAGPQTDYFNSHWRTTLDRTPVLRQILGLHDNGDARSDYLGSRFSSIYITVNAVYDVTVDTAVLDRFAAAVRDVTGKPASYRVVYNNISQTDLSDDDVAGIFNRYHSPIPSGAASLTVLIADTHQNEPNLLGSTFQEYGIVMYKKTLEGFTSAAPSTLGNYELSTLLHEFGHQIGLGHNNIPGCLMNSQAEQNNAAITDPAFVVTDFCQPELEQINMQKALSQ